MQHRLTVFDTCDIGPGRHFRRIPELGSENPASCLIDSETRAWASAVSRIASQAFGILFSPEPLIRILSFLESDSNKHVFIGTGFKRTTRPPGNFHRTDIRRKSSTEEAEPDLWFVIVQEDVYKHCRPAIHGLGGSRESKLRER